MARSTGTIVRQGRGSARELQSAHTHAEAARMGRLTARQLGVLELLAKGLSNEQIGVALAISAATVRAHVAAILNTLEAGNRTEAAADYVAFAAQPAQVEAVLGRPAITVLPFQALDDEPTSRQLALRRRRRARRAPGCSAGLAAQRQSHPRRQAGWLVARHAGRHRSSGRRAHEL